MNNTGDEQLNAVIADYLRRRDAGLSVDEEALLQAHPELADALRSYFAAEVMIGELAGHKTPIPASRAILPDVRRTLRPGSTDDTASEFTVRRFGRYELLRQLGEGAMGTVYLARDTVLNRLVALKVPKLGVTDDAEFAQRFVREAQAAGALQHPGICHVHDVGEHKGTPYITMEFIDGVSLSQLIGSRRLTAINDVLRMIQDIADAIEHAHFKGVIHRDLKPGNIIVDADFRPHITDFGLARQLEGEDEARITHEGHLLGTPAYMAPEQVRGDHDVVGPQSDVYSLGVMLFELLTGRLPFEGSVPEMLAQVLCDAPPCPSSVRRDIPEAIDAMCLRMLNRDPAERYATMCAVRQDIDQFFLQTRLHKHGRPVSIATAITSIDGRHPADAVTAGGAADDASSLPNPADEGHSPAQSVAHHDAAKLTPRDMGPDAPFAAAARGLSHTDVPLPTTEWSGDNDISSVARGWIHTSLLLAMRNTWLRAGGLLLVALGVVFIIQFRRDNRLLTVKLTDDLGKDGNITLTIDDSPNLNASTNAASPIHESRFPTDAELAIDGDPFADTSLVAGTRWSHSVAGHFRWCPPGEFLMGSPTSEPAREDNEASIRVSLSAGFWTAETEVTQELFELLMGTRPWSVFSEIPDNSKAAACGVLWDDATEACRRLTDSEHAAGRLPRTARFMLPTEAQWEYACRAGTTTAFHFGDDPALFNDYGWLRNNTEQHGHPYPQIVGLQRPNDWGLHDMHGNVYEWCRDNYSPRYIDGTDPFIQTGEIRRVNRGGAWNRDEGACRSANRKWNFAHVHAPDVGFRLALIHDPDFDPDNSDEASGLPPTALP